jgi:hypothetical protein
VKSQFFFDAEPGTARYMFDSSIKNLTQLLGPPGVRLASWGSWGSWETSWKHFRIVFWDSQFGICWNHHMTLWQTLFRWLETLSSWIALWGGCASGMYKGWTDETGVKK